MSDIGTAKRKREHAARARRLARDIEDPKMHAAMNAFADEADAQASEIERDLTRPDQPAIPLAQVLAQTQASIRDPKKPPGK